MEIRHGCDSRPIPTISKTLIGSLLENKAIWYSLWLKSGVETMDNHARRLRELNQIVQKTQQRKLLKFVLVCGPNSFSSSGPGVYEKVVGGGRRDPLQRVRAHDVPMGGWGLTRVGFSLRRPQKSDEEGRRGE